MSRIGKLPITPVDGVTLQVDGQKVTAKGPKGSLDFTVPNACIITFDEKQAQEPLRLKPVDDSKKSRALWGMSRTMIQNLIIGVSQGYSKNLELVGVGYRAQMKGKVLSLALGFSHEVNFEPPEGIKIVTAKPTEIEISGINKQEVGQTAAVIRAYRPPEPYKGKGIKYKNEYIFRKEGKRK